MAVWSCGLRLRVVEGTPKGRVYALDAPVFNIGRAYEAGIRAKGWLLLDDGTVSRVQATLTWNPNTRSFFLSNRSETNPTKVNEQTVTVDAELKAGDLIQVGRCVLQLQEGTKMPPGYLEVIEGPECGQRYSLDSLNVVLGGPLNGEVTEENKCWFDQEIVLSDESIAARCLALSWNPRANGFDLWRPQGGYIKVSVQRSIGGMTWKAQLPVEHEGVVLPDDIISVGKSRLQIHLGMVTDDEASVAPESEEVEEVARFHGPMGAVGLRRPRKLPKTLEI